MRSDKGDASVVQRPPPDTTSTPNARLLGFHYRGDRMPKAPRTYGQKPARRSWRHRQPAAARGYDRDWQREAAACRESVGHLCEGCLADGKLTEDGLEVHHIEAFTSLDDPRRLDPGNLRLLCRSCHRKAEHRRKGGADRLRG